MHVQRFTIAWLMGLVLAVSLGLAALRLDSDFIAGIVFMMTSAVLALAVVGAACRREAARAPWLGFALFGWGYLALACWHEQFPTPLPTMTLLWAIVPDFNDPLSRWEVGHSVWALLAAPLGGLLAHACFGAPQGRPGPSNAVGPAVEQVPRKGWRRPLASGSVALLLVALGAALGSDFTAGTWAGPIVIVTWGAIGLAAVGAIGAQGRRRLFCLGAAVFGAGSMILLLGRGPELMPAPARASERLVREIQSRLPLVARRLRGSVDPVVAANARIVHALESPTNNLVFPNDTALEDVLNDIRGATKQPDGWQIPIYVDPVGLNYAEKTMTSPVAIRLEGVPLKTSLRLMLRQLGLEYTVRGGVLLICAEDGDEL
jgi:hypothetical protein